MSCCCGGLGLVACLPCSCSVMLVMQSLGSILHSLCLNQCCICKPAYAKKKEGFLCSKSLSTSREREHIDLNSNFPARLLILTILSPTFCRDGERSCFFSTSLSEFSAWTILSQPLTSWHHSYVTQSPKIMHTFAAPILRIQLHFRRSVGQSVTWGWFSG